jgi:hypothetical protein
MTEAYAWVPWLLSLAGALLVAVVLIRRDRARRRRKGRPVYLWPR